MSESKYDDPSPESKQEEEEKSEGASFLSPLVAAFAEFATSQAFGSDLHNFELENSSTFNGAELDGEQHLEWTDIFNSYVMLIEGKMEEFCEEHGSSAEQLFKEISEVNDDPIVSGFLPQVLMNCEYTHFLKQMKEVAESSSNKDLAVSAAAKIDSDGDSKNISGVYKSTGDFNEKNFLLFLKHCKCPWVLRKLFCKTAKNIENVFCVQDENKMTFKYKMKFFGSKSETYILDNASRPKKNIWNVVADQRAYRDSSTGKIHVMLDDHPSLGAGGTTEHVFYNDVDDEGNKILVWDQILKDPSIDVVVNSSMSFSHEKDGGGGGRK
ncbi:hypothetical protein TL16_g12931 [Triparma laevis f. inornata]|uniref:Cilia- and flagella-associated protein 36 n=2 Tax=Triparma laevis TaxID=1534972 RepID=A0A9W7A7R8_9STRA|nr:hypothetical protein TrLO_g3500 [Triparma laevis f. longispina]GMH94528.1 hypothetical protein TL16_g12931 [Triparma laevis f. inornata]